MGNKVVLVVVVVVIVVVIIVDLNNCLMKNSTEVGSAG
jgi:hypothetical protein